MQLVTSRYWRFGYLCRNPILRVFVGLFEVFVDCIKLFKRNLFLKFIEVENSDFDESFSAFVGSVGCGILSFLVKSINLTHLGEHGVFLIDFVFFYILTQFLFTLYLTLLEPTQVL